MHTQIEQTTPVLHGHEEIHIVGRFHPAFGDRAKMWMLKSPGTWPKIAASSEVSGVFCG